MGFWEDLSTMFKKGVTVVAQKTDEYTKLGKIKVEIMGIKRDIERRTNELGTKVYQLIVEENDTKISANSDVKQFIDTIKELNAKLALKNQEYDQVRQEYAAKTGKPADSIDTGVAGSNEARG